MSFGKYVDFARGRSYHGGVSVTNRAAPFSLNQHPVVGPTLWMADCGHSCLPLGTSPRVSGPITELCSGELLQGDLGIIPHFVA